MSRKLDQIWIPGYIYQNSLQIHYLLLHLDAFLAKHASLQVRNYWCLRLDLDMQRHVKVWFDVILIHWYLKLCKDKQLPPNIVVEAVSFEKML